MPEALNFHFPIPLLLKEGELILNAADQYAAPLAARLKPEFLAGTRALLGQVSDKDTDQKSSAGDLGTLTQEQDDKLGVLNVLLHDARETAKKAFKGQDVKLREIFQVGVNKPTGLGAVLQRARITLAGLRKAEHLPALTAKGWIEADAAQLDAAIRALAATDNTQENAKSGGPRATGERNQLANQLYAGIETVQNAAHLQFPDRDPANASIRKEFRLGKFPPSGGSPPKPEPPKPPPPPA